MITTLQQIIDERISFPKEQPNHDENKPELNSTFQLQIDAIRSVEDDIELIEPIILQKKALLKNSEEMHESDRLLAELDDFEWLQRQIANTLDDKEAANTTDMMPPNNTTFPTINKSPSHYVCCKCTTKPADYYVLTGNPKAPSEMIPLCYACYYNHSGRRGGGKNTRT